ncbi:Protein NDH-DEPENDENT CYCLIC ELECTRON FLOW 5 [Hirschfeldia incana]|nr:Protein NDH-DEPENDENT CYCLIC ELECTRON FLOW 5 [Hirschfeldia incana]
MALSHSTIVSHSSSLPMCRYSKLRLLSSPSLPLHFNKNVKRLESFHLPPPAAAAASSYFPIDVEYLQREFSGHGATFEDIGETCVAKLKLDNGNSANVMLTRGLVTSYKVKVWHGGKVELLHTWVEQEQQEVVVIRGGVSSAFSSSDGINEWSLHGITGDSNECVQVELRRGDKKMKEIEMKQIITLRGDTLSIELCVANKGVSPISIKGCSLVSYLTVSTPEATYAVGLEGSDFVEKTPFLPRFGLVQGEDEEEGKYGLSGEEESNYKQLSEEMSRIYTLAPSSFTIIDRKELSGGG